MLVARGIATLSQELPQTAVVLHIAVNVAQVRQTMNATGFATGQ
jgi:hypothetical protein